MIGDCSLRRISDDTVQPVVKELFESLRILTPQNWEIRRVQRPDISAQMDIVRQFAVHREQLLKRRFLL